jgi:hypothetical protein
VLGYVMLCGMLEGVMEVKCTENKYLLIKIHLVNHCPVNLFQTHLINTCDRM